MTYARLVCSCRDIEGEGRCEACRARSRELLTGLLRSPQAWAVALAALVFLMLVKELAR